jgi:hypothetical protein
MGHRIMAEKERIGIVGIGRMISATFLIGVNVGWGHTDFALNWITTSLGMSRDRQAMS